MRGVRIVHIVQLTANIQTETFKRGRRYGVRIFTGPDVPLPHEDFAKALRRRLGTIRLMQPRFVKTVMKRRGDKHVWFEMTLPPGNYQSAAVCFEKLLVPRILTEQRTYEPRAAKPRIKQQTVRRPQFAHA
jgi:hypothetical protein